MSVTQIVDKDQGPRRRRFPGLRVPPNLFAIVLGIAGLAEAWHAAVPVLGGCAVSLLNVLPALCCPPRVLPPVSWPPPLSLLPFPPPLLLPPPRPTPLPSGGFSLSSSLLLPPSGLFSG